MNASTGHQHRSDRGHGTAPLLDLGIKVTEEQQVALLVARLLINFGIPVFAAPPARSGEGWEPAGGTKGMGYWLPPGYQNTTPDLRWLDPSSPGFEHRAWRPGWALCMVTGCGLDVIDTDPRHGGDSSRQQLEQADLLPKVYATASTPSGGTHEFVATLGVSSLNNLYAGVDLKAGKADRTGRGFIFLAPTRRVSKDTGEIASYLWASQPRPEELQRIPGDDSGAGLAARRAISRGSSGRPAAEGRCTSVPPWVEIEQSQPACSVVAARLNTARDALKGTHRHESMLTAATALMRLRMQGHGGGAGALTDLRDNFIAAVSTTRAGAGDEFDRALSGAWEGLLPPRDPAPHRICACRLATLRRLYEAGHLLDNGTARNTQIKVLRFLLMYAERQGTLYIRDVSQRQISAGIDVHQPTIAKALDKLQAKGLLMIKRARTISGKSSYLLTTPETLKDLSQKGEKREKADPSCDNSVRALVHPLFGAGGLSGSIADTYAALSEQRRRIPVGYLVPIKAGSRVTPMLLNPYVGSRQIPRPRQDGQGRSVKQLAALCGRHESTIRKHLNTLQMNGLVYQRAGRWWRNRVDPDAVVADACIVDTANGKRIKHDADRLRRAEALCLLADPDGVPLAERRIIDETGEIIDTGGRRVWRGPLPASWSEEDVREVSSDS